MAAIEEAEKGSSILQMTEKGYGRAILSHEAASGLFCTRFIKSCDTPRAAERRLARQSANRFEKLLKEYEFEFLQELKALDIRMEDLMLKYAGEQWADHLQKSDLNGNVIFRFISRLTGLETESWETIEA